MNSHTMYLAMMLSHARRANASALVIAAEPTPARIEMLMPDGESRPFPAPSPEAVRELIALLESGERQFAATVHTATVIDVDIIRTKGRLNARIEAWEIETE